ncbi:MAG TPA: hypothetical protein VFH34_15560 [Anaerolineales bacterium]|nr:hypothetical protein [Anaerolineales bacterium]
MEIYLIWLLRIIHIVAGVFWVGSAVFMTVFIAPTAGALGESGQRFVGHMLSNTKFSTRMAIASGSTILAGAILYGLDARAGEAWLQSSFAIGLGIGAAFAVIGFVFGILVGRTTTAMAQLGAQVQGKPTAEQMTRLQSMQSQLRTYSMVNVASLILATIFMAIARYL